MGKRHQPEEIIGKLREAEIVLAQGGISDLSARAFGRALVLPRRTRGGRTCGSAFNAGPPVIMG